MTAEDKRKLKLLDEMAKDDNPWIAKRAKHLRTQMRYSMDVILKKVVPGGTVMEKAAKIGISRQAYYAWLNGLSRPSMEQAKLLSRMTGYTVEQIRGREVYSPPRVNPPAPRRRRTRAPRRVKSNSDNLPV
jgi:transcriptional regulator with XRE-family HTH domain